MVGIFHRGSQVAPFTIHVPVKVRFDPSQHNLAQWQPAPIRKTAQIAPVYLGSGYGGYGTPDEESSASSCSCVFTVASATLNRNHVIVLGDNRLVPYLHYLPVSGNVNSTATAIAAAINALPKFSATANVATVTVTYDGPPGDLVRFEILQGTTVAFTSVTDGGWMTTGKPDAGPIILG